MSRLGKLPIQKQNAVIAVSDNVLRVSGEKGELSFPLPSGVVVREADNEIFIDRVGNDKLARSLQGTVYAICKNMIQGVTEGWKKELEIIGVGYRASVSGNKLILNIGYSHPIEIEAPAGISFFVEKNLVSVSGIDKQMVGEVSAKIRAARPPEPYKGTGIRYKDEVVRRKAGKQAAKTGE